MFDTVFGLPVHSLVIHVTVIGLPLGALFTAVVAVRPGWRSRYAWWAVAVNGLLLAATFVAQESGKQLYERLGAPPEAATHRELALTLVWFALALLVASILLAPPLAAVALARSHGVAVHVLTVVVVAVAAASVVQVARVGHAGTEAVWGSTVESTNP
ncbi:MAG: DUF2231 domain-containing protein [Carbonactinosporaceae bacterium]